MNTTKGQSTLSKISISTIIAIFISLILLKPAYAEIPTKIDYHGFVKSGGSQFNGRGELKVAIVNSDGFTSYWSNDGTSTSGSEPTAPVSVDVTNGVFNVVLGDTSVTNMTIISESVFNNSNTYLRVWFNGEQLSPDKQIIAVPYAYHANNADTLEGLSAPPSGDIVGTSTTQTITNKTIDGDTNTLQDISDNSLNQITTANKVAGSAVQLNTSGGLENSSGLGVNLDGSTLTLSVNGLRVSETYSGNTNLSTLGTVDTGTWEGNRIGFDYLPLGGNWTLTSNLNIDSNTLYIDQSNSRVGIGTSNPSNTFEVANLISFDNTNNVKLTAFGYKAGDLNESSSSYSANGNFNTFIGYRAGEYNSSGDNNTAIGYNSFRTNTTGFGNIAIGAAALQNNSTGTMNTIIGNIALGYCNAADSCTAIGYGTLFNNENDGDYNSALGNMTLSDNTTGAYNTAIGYLAGDFNTTGNNNTYIGHNARTTNGSNFSNATAIGSNAVVNASNKVVIGNSSVTTIGGYANWTNYSDFRLKENITDCNLGLDFISKIRPVSYTLKDDANKVKRQGVIAQEVKEIMDELGVHFAGYTPPPDKDGKGMRMISYSTFVLPLINAVKEQQEQIEEQNKQIQKQQKQIDALIAKIK